MTNNLWKALQFATRRRNTQGCASVYLRGKILLIGTASIYNAYRLRSDVWAGAIIREWDTYKRILKIDAAPEEIGSALRGAFLASSVYLGPPGDRSKLSHWAPHYIPNGELAEAFGLKSSKGLSAELKSCAAGCAEGEVGFSPLLRDRGLFFYPYREPWADQHPDTFVAFDAPDFDLGLALKACLAHCG